MAELNLRIRVSVPLARWGLAGTLLIAFAAEPSTESFNLPTYYPAPSGIYGRMITTQGALLARDGGKVGVGTTNPQALLDVNDGARIGGNLQTGGISPAGDISAGNITAAGVSVSAPGDVKVNGQSVMTAFNCPPGLKCTVETPHTLTISPGCTCADWADAGCSTGGCGAYQRQQTRTCAPAGCGITSQCVADNSCVPPCTVSGWTNFGCGAGGCANQMLQTQSCSPSGCTGCPGTSRCVSDASCLPPPTPTPTPPPSPACSKSCGQVCSGFYTCAFYASWMPPCNWCACYTSPTKIQMIVPCDGCRKACYGY